MLHSHGSISYYLHMSYPTQEKGIIQGHGSSLKFCLSQILQELKVIFPSQRSLCFHNLPTMFCVSFIYTIMFIIYFLDNPHMDIVFH